MVSYNPFGEKHLLKMIFFGNSSKFRCICISERMYKDLQFMRDDAKTCSEWCHTLDLKKPINLRKLQKKSDFLDSFLFSVHICLCKTVKNMKCIEIVS